MINIGTLRAARVFIAFTFPEPSKCVELLDFRCKRERFRPYKFSHCALFKKWRSNGVMNFKNDDPNHSIYKFYMLLSVFYALSKAMEATNRCFLLSF